jgi:glycosyltransferase involved in cell wall biosynthesis
MSDRPLRILVGADVPPDPNAGASGTVVQMNAALRRLGHTVDEIWQDDLGRRIRHGNLHYLLELPRAFRRVVRERTRTQVYDVIELNQPHAYLAAEDHRYSGRPGVFVNRSHGHEVRSDETLALWREREGTPRRSQFRRQASAVVRNLLGRQWDRIARSTDGFVVSCTEDADFLAERYALPREVIGVVTQGVPDSYRDHPTAAYTFERAGRLLYVGQLAFFKAPRVLAECISEVLASRPHATMTWVCSREHHAAARGLLAPPVHARVTFLDWMSQDDLRDVLDRHGVFLFPSFFEGFGKAPLEAMSRGLCVVASDTGGMRDYVRDGVSGSLVPAGRPDLLAQRTLALLDDLVSARRMSLAAREASAGHSWERCAREATDFYRSLVGVRSGSGAARTSQRAARVPSMEQIPVPN